MELLKPDVYRRLFENKRLADIVAERKRIETKISTIQAGKNPLLTTGSLFGKELDEKKDDKPAEDPIEIKGTGNKEDMLTTTTSGEKSELAIYMEYAKILTEFIHNKSIYMNDAAYKASLNGKNMQELMEIRNSLVDDINRYYKEINSMRTKEMLLAIPILKNLVKNKNVNENIDIIEVVLKKEEYVKYIDELLAKENQKIIDEKTKDIK